jgi:DNA-binding CsgD family transcriptional regulator
MPDPQVLLALLQAGLADAPIGFLLLDEVGRPLWHNPEAANVCAIWNHGEGDPARRSASPLAVPPILWATCRLMRASWPGAGPLPAMQSVNDPRRYLYARLGMQVGGVIGFHLQLRQHRPRPDNLSPLSPAAQALLEKLSVRERTVALQVRNGLTNREIATALERSPLTIKTHLSSICEKLGVRGRARLVALLNR